MVKLASYAEPSQLEKRSELKEFFKDQIQLLDSKGLSVEEVLKTDFDLLEIPLRLFKEFLPHLRAISLQVYELSLADCLVRKGVENSFKEVTSLSFALQQVILEKIKTLSTSGRVLICGEEAFLVTAAQQFYRMGFSKFLLCSLSENNRNQEITARLTKGYFGIELTFSKLEELNQVQISSDLMIMNIDKVQDAEFYESLSYFNYLSRDAIFIDLQDYLYPELKEEAERTGLRIIESLDVYRQQYKYLLDLLKNTP